MTLHHTIGSLADQVALRDAKAAVRQVERNFPDVKAIIDQMVQSKNPKSRKATEKARDEAIVSQLVFNDDFALAVSDRMLELLLTGR
jgi:dihydropteroate synthase